MKYKSTFCAIVLLLHFSVYAAVIEKTYYFTDVQITRTGNYHTINFANTLLTGKMGEPTLPYHAVALLLPPGEIADRVDLIRHDEVEIAGKFRLWPQQPPRHTSADRSSDFVVNPQIYESASEYPPDCLGGVSTEFMNGYSFGLLTFTPLKYQPVIGKVTYFSRVTVQITTKPGVPGLSGQLTSCTSVRKRIQNFAHNPDLLSLYSLQKSNPDTYQLLILTPSLFAQYYPGLIDLYQIRGLESTIATIEQIESNAPGRDLPEKIRNYIIQEYQNHDIEHVLLGGDAEWIPYRGFYCKVRSGGQDIIDANIPADLYYAALDGSWNDDNDSLWGEIGEDDLLPEISVGRLPVSEVMDLENMLHKIISYQNNPVCGELRSPLLAGEKLYDEPLTWGGDYLDLLVGRRVDNGYVTNGISKFDNIVKLYDRDLGHWDVDMLLQKISKGPSFIHHDGHSSYSYNMRLFLSDITNANFSTINGTDHNFVPVYSNGCNCAGFDRDDCIGERMVTLENFAVVFIGNSRYGWFNEGTTEGPAIHIHREFIDALYGHRIARVGAAFLDGKIDTAPWLNAPDQYEEGAIRWNFYACNILGDPAMAIWTNEPGPVSADYQQAIPVDLTVFPVDVLGNGVPVAGFNCVLMQGDKIYGMATTDQNGHAEIRLDSLLAEANDLNLVISGYNCLPTFFPVSVLTSVHEKAGFIPTTTELLHNFPNPFNPTTTISFSLNKESSSTDIRLIIYNVKGELVKQLYDGRLTPGRHSISWDGTDLSGRQVSTGIYFYQLQTQNRFYLGKMLRIQ